MFRGWFVVLAAWVVVVLSGVGATAQAASVSGGSAAMDSTAVLRVSYSLDHVSGCGLGSATCAAHLYEVEEDGSLGGISSCGPSEDASCEITVYGESYARKVQDPSSDSYVARYRACNGDGSDCSVTSFTWTPWPVQLGIRSSPSTIAPGRTEVTLSGGRSLPPSGSIELYDLNNKRAVGSISTGSAASCDNGQQHCEITFYVGGLECAGPYFEGRYLPSSGPFVSKRTGPIRVNGITASGQPCSDDSGHEGSGGGSGPGGGGSPPTPPTVKLTGSSQYTIPDESDIVISPSAATDYPYEMIVRDTSDGNRVVGSCMASTICGVRLNHDLEARESVVHRLVSETHVGGEVVGAPGETMDVTVYPYAAKARLRYLGMTSIGAGVAQLRYSGVAGRRVGTYQLVLQARDPDDARPRWTNVETCYGATVDCKTSYAMTSRPDGRVDTMEFRAVFMLNGQIIPKSQSAIATVRAQGGQDIDALLATVDAEWCGRVVAKNPPPRTQSSAGVPAQLCSAKATARDALLDILEFIASQYGVDGVEDFVTWAVDNLNDPGAGGSSPGGSTGGTGGTTNPVYDDIIERIARNLRLVNSNTAPELSAALSRTVARACLRAMAFKAASDFGADDGSNVEHCVEPEIPFFVIGSDVQEAARHKFDAIYGNTQDNTAPTPGWMNLNYEQTTERAADGQTRIIKPARGWYTRDPRFSNNCGDTSRGSGYQCDEFPWFSTQQGGQLATPRPSIRRVLEQHNTREGALLSSKLFARCGLTQPQQSWPTKSSNGSGGSEFLVLPLPQGPTAAWPRAGTGLGGYSDRTFGICNDPRQGGGGGGVS